MRAFPSFIPEKIQAAWLHLNRAGTAFAAYETASSTETPPTNYHRCLIRADVLSMTECTALNKGKREPAVVILLPNRDPRPSRARLLTRQVCRLEHHSCFPITGVRGGRQGGRA